MIKLNPTRQKQIRTTQPKDPWQKMNVRN